MNYKRIASHHWDYLFEVYRAYHHTWSDLEMYEKVLKQSLVETDREVARQNGISPARVHEVRKCIYRWALWYLDHPARLQLVPRRKGI